MNYEERITLARTELAESGTTTFVMNDAATPEEAQQLIRAVCYGAGHPAVHVDLLPNAAPIIRFTVPSFTTRTWERARRRWHMAKLN